MIFGLFRGRGRNDQIVSGLYAALADASRSPALYRDLGVPDTFEGRFESITLHAFLVVRRLRALPPPAGDLAQDVIDTIFRHFDAALREMGVGDLTVPKRMKTMASAFYGRAKAYEEAMPDDAALSGALVRNIHGGKAPLGDDGAALLSYVRRSEAALAALGFDDFVAARLSFPDPRADGAAA